MDEDRRKLMGWGLAIVVSLILWRMIYLGISAFVVVVNGGWFK